MTLNFAQIINNSALMSNALKTRVLNAVVYSHGYKDQIFQNGPMGGQLIDNPVSKVQFYNNVLTEFHYKALEDYEGVNAASLAKQAKIDEIRSLKIE